jgi:hypothetical protein
MIGAALRFIREELDAAMREASSRPCSRLTLGPPQASAEATDPGDPGTLRMTLVRVSEEAARPPLHNTNLPEQTPPLLLHLHLLFSIDPSSYEPGLSLLSWVIGRLRDRPVYSRANTPGLPEGIEKLSFSMENLSLAEQDHLWGSLGSRHRPSVAYTVRLIAIPGEGPLALDPDPEEAPAPEGESLATRAEAGARWESLALDPRTERPLRELARHMKLRHTVHERWGFRPIGGPGPGVTALFHGPSGTGKSMAAEVLATELGLSLYRVDLAALISKYIGETEKNLGALLTRAEGFGAILLFDEADALFGEQSSVPDSHDRYANLGVAYLLRRLESYEGLSILCISMEEGLDPELRRRLRHKVPFHAPDQDQRRRIWERVFPARVPREELDPELLSRLRLSGAQIREVALGAAFLAAERGGAVRMRDLRRAALRELERIGRSPTAAELTGWPDEDGE